jgi:hypothetical protein
MTERWLHSGGHFGLGDSRPWDICVNDVGLELYGAESSAP